MNPDFEELFALLNRHGVEFLVIGGVAYNYHAPPRATKDIDVWVGPSRGNLERLLLALAEFGLDVTEVEVNVLLQNARVLMIGRVPNRVDVLTRPDSYGTTHGRGASLWIMERPPLEFLPSPT